MVASAHPVDKLVGRELELRELHAALTNAEKGRGGLALIVGEPGIGKTALADEFARAAVERGAMLAWGRVWEAGGAPPFWPWIEVLRELSQQGVDLAMVAIRRHLAVVAELVPELAAATSDLEAPPSLDPVQARFRLFEAITSLLRWGARTRPLVVVIDDLHAADEATLSLLLFAVRGVRRARVVIVGTFREAEPGIGASTAELLARIAREGRYLRLGRLDSDAVARLLSERGVATAPGVVDDLYRRSEGNPLFLVEMARLLGTGSPLAEAVPRFLPSEVRELIGARLRSLPESCRTLLEAAAVLGRVVDRRMLATICAVPDEQVGHELAVAERSQVVARTGDDRWSFTHILLRDVLHAGLPLARRAELHQVVARAFMQGVGEASTAEVAQHLFEAIPLNGATEAIEWARRAARQSRERLAFDDAVAFMDRALGAMPCDADIGERCDLLLELSAACIDAGHGERGREMALAAAELARTLADARRLALAALAYGGVFTYASVNETLVGLLEEALGALRGEHVELRARLLGRLAAALQPAANPSEPMVIARQAIAMTRQLGEPNLRLDVLQSATSALLYFGEPEERLPLNHELLELAERHGDRLRAARARLRLVFDYLEQGKADQADFCIDAFEALVNELGHPNYLWYAPLLRSQRAALRGAFSEAEQQVERSRVLAERSREPNRRLTFAMHRLCLLMLAARGETLAEEGPALLRVLSESTDPWIHAPMRARLAASWGQIEQARAALAVYDGDLAQGRHRMAVAWIVEAAVAMNDRGLAALAYERLLPMSARNHCIGVTGCFCLGPMTHPLGSAASLLENWAAAWQHFEVSLQRADALASPPLRAQIELDYAIGLLRRSSNEDRERARALLDSAASTADRFDLPSIADACTEHLDRLRQGEARSAASDRPTKAAVPEARGFDLVMNGDAWIVTWGEQSFELEDSRGLQILHQLVSQPGREIHVTDLLAPGGQSGLLQDAGNMLDDTAIASYRSRVEELQEELAEAEQWNDSARAEWLNQELDELRKELSRAVGLGGRKRKAASTSERARVNVRRRLVHALAKLEPLCPELVGYLNWTVKTGHYCVYHPAGRPR